MTKIYLRKLTRYLKAAESSSSQLHPQQEDCQPRANIGAVERNTAASKSLAVATASSDYGKDTSQADRDHASQPSHSDNESETGGPTLQPPETPCCTTSSRPCPAHAWLKDRTARERLWLLMLLLCGCWVYRFRTKETIWQWMGILDWGLKRVVAVVKF